MGKSKNKNPYGLKGEMVNFMKQRYVALIFSAVLLLCSLISLGVNGLQFGLDFTGGLQLEAQFSEKADLVQIRKSLSENGLSEKTSLLKTSCVVTSKYFV